MFERSLTQKLKRIFDLPKATFSIPGESQEQECIFIQVESSNNSIKEKRQVAKVIGKLRIFCNTDKLPYGYFSKKIQAANLEDTGNLFFYNIEENAGTFENISERSMNFVYLFDSQYDPNRGTLNELDTEFQTGS